ncbi:hypothetical protein KAR91_54280, partial [Candidatus Pacearchaeota archaeon]|nr:hypothetical protein [Candidatus Pacearchaeota archaeon]
MKRLLLLFLLIPSIAFGFLPPTAEVPLPDDTPYNATSWDGNVSAATKNAIRDEIEFIIAGGVDAATETTPGIVELATDAETVT